MGIPVVYRDQPRGDYLESAPALAVEVISASNTAEQMDRKVKTYLTNGGVEVGLVYPKTRSVWVYREGHAEEASCAPVCCPASKSISTSYSTKRTALRTSSSRISMSRFVVR